MDPVPDGARPIPEEEAAAPCAAPDPPSPSPSPSSSSISFSSPHASAFAYSFFESSPYCSHTLAYSPISLPLYFSISLLTMGSFFGFLFLYTASICTFQKSSFVSTTTLSRFFGDVSPTAAPSSAFFVSSSIFFALVVPWSLVSVLLPATPSIDGVLLDACGAASVAAGALGFTLVKPANGFGFSFSISVPVPSVGAAADEPRPWVRPENGFLLSLFSSPAFPPVAPIITPANGLFFASELPSAELIPANGLLSGGIELSV